MIKRNSEQKDDTARGILEEWGDIHEAHAVVQAAHEERPNQGAENATTASGESSAANDRGGDGIKLEEQASAPRNRPADTGRQRHTGYAIGQPGDDKIPEDRF